MKRRAWNARCTVMALAMTATMVAAAGCGGVEEGALDGETVAKASQAVCTSGADYDATANIYYFSEGMKVTRTSPYPTQNCFYTVEVRGLQYNQNNHILRPYVDWGEAGPGSEQACRNAYIRVRTEAFYTLGGWTRVGDDVVIRGTWIGLCAFFQDSLPFLLPNSNRRKLRVSAMAYQRVGFFPVPKRVTAGATVPAGNPD